MKAANRGFLSRDALAIEVTNSYSAADASYQVRPRRDRRGVDPIFDVLSFAGSRLVDRTL
jgi:hypothetical protein